MNFTARNGTPWGRATARLEGDRAPGGFVECLAGGAPSPRNESDPAVTGPAAPTFADQDGDYAGSG